MNFWTSDGTVDTNNFRNFVDIVVNEIHDIIYDLLKNKAFTVELRKQLLDIDIFSNLYDQYNYKQKYKPFIYYGLRKYSVLTNFYLPEVQANNQSVAVSPFEAATNVVLEIDELGFKNVTKNRGFELLVHFASIDAAHKYIIEKTAHEINITEKTELNTIIDELLKDDKNLFVKYKDIYIKYVQFLIQEKVELFNHIYKTDPEGFVRFLNYVFEADFFKENVYFLRIGNKLYVTNERGIQKEIEDEFVKININLLPENIYIPSPYFYVYLNLSAELFTIFERLLFTFINDNNIYPITINAVTYNLTPQEMLQVFILTVYKNIIEILYGIKLAFRKINNIDTTIIDLYNIMKNSNEDNTNNCFDIFNNCILAKLCSENKNSNTYFAGRFNREIAGIIQIIVNSSSDTLVNIYNSSTIDDAKNIAFYLVDLFNYLCEEDTNTSYLNKYSKKTIQQLATYLVDLPYRIILYLIIQKINLYKDHFIYSADKQIFKSLFEIKDYYYNFMFDLSNANKLTICNNNNNNTNNTSCSNSSTNMLNCTFQLHKKFNSIDINNISKNFSNIILNYNLELISICNNHISCCNNNINILNYMHQLSKKFSSIDINCISKNFSDIVLNYDLKLININNNFGVNSENFKINRDLTYYCNTSYENNSCNINNNQSITNNSLTTYDIINSLKMTFTSSQQYTIKAEGLSRFCNLCTINDIILNITYLDNRDITYSIENKKSKTKLCINNSEIQYNNYNMNNIIDCINSINLNNKVTTTRIYLQNNM